jgi:hypothetical protein
MADRVANPSRFLAFRSLAAANYAASGTARAKPRQSGSACPVRCEECGTEAEGKAEGWRAFLGNDLRDRTMSPRRSSTARRAPSASSVSREDATRRAVTIPE